MCPESERIEIESRYSVCLALFEIESLHGPCFVLFARRIEIDRRGVSGTICVDKSTSLSCISSPCISGGAENLSSHLDKWSGISPTKFNECTYIFEKWPSGRDGRGDVPLALSFRFLVAVGTTRSVFEVGVDEANRDDVRGEYAVAAADSPRVQRVAPAVEA